MSLRSWFSRGCNLGLSGVLILVGAIVKQGGDRTFAQVVEDPSLNTKVTPNADGTILKITGGTTAGDTNLFHSFRNFSVKNNEVVDFDNAATINNILVRVTGGNPSEIQGTLRSQGKANLFLINPNGIVFGENAFLEIGGSFIGTTASAIEFPGGGEFSMTSSVNPLNPLLKVNPSAFLFNQIAAESIKSIQVNDALLSVNEGQSLLLVGGNVNLEGAQLVATDGRVELGGLNGVGTVGLNNDTSNFRLSFPVGVQQADVFLSNKATVTASGAGGGGIQVQGRHVKLTDGSDIAVNTLASKSGATLAVNASELVELLGGSRLLTNTVESGTAGELRIETGRLIVRDGSQVSASTLSQGQGGTLFVTARDSINLIGTSAGDNPSPSGLFSLAEKGSTGNAGNLKIETGQLIVQDGAQVSASTLSQGNGGKLSVTARNLIQLIRTSAIGKPSGLFVGTEAGGAAGNLDIETGQLIVQDGARISASTSRESTGVGGSIIVRTGELNILNRAEVTASSQGAKQAGDLEITARSIKLDNQSKLIGQTASADGGNINLQVQDLLLMRHGSEISTTAGIAGAGGNGGNITINDPSNRTGFVVAAPLENNDITANAFNSEGGKISINATGIFGMIKRSREDLVRLLGTNLDPKLLPTNDITAISQTSPTLNGTVTVNTLDVDPNRGLLNLPTVPVDTSVAQTCTAGGTVAKSEFIITGRGGLPSNPNEALSTDAVQVDLVTLNSEVDKRSTPTVSTTLTTPTPTIVEATGWVIDKHGNVVLTANAPTLEPNSSWHKSADCHAFNQQ